MKSESYNVDSMTANDNQPCKDCIGHEYAVDDLVIVKKTKVQEYGTFLLVGVICKVVDDIYHVRPIISSHPIDISKIIKVTNPVTDMVAITEDFITNILVYKLSI